MGVKEAKRQKKLAKKRAKDKQRRHVIAAKKQALTSLRGQMQAASRGEIVGCWRLEPRDTDTDYDGNLTPVLLIRKTTNGCLGLAQFLVDLSCLGVKNCFGTVDFPDRILDFQENLRQTFTLVPIAPETGLAIIQAGLDYAARFGLGPHEAYRNVKMIWGDVACGELPAEFELGCEGKPFYVAGPHENLAKQNEIIQSLTNSVGPDGFEFLGHVSSFGMEMNETFADDRFLD